MKKLKISSDAQSKSVLVGVLNANDLISRLPKDVMLNILSRLSIDESIRTGVLSTRWEHVWKEVPHLFLDMQKNRHVLIDGGISMTKVINTHRVHLESCTIIHYSFQCTARMIETWIQALVHVKNVKYLAVIDYFGYTIGNKANISLVLPPDSFCHPNLESVVLSQYNLEAPRGFNKCENLKSLSLKIVFTNIEVFNTMLASCTSLQVLVLQISCHERSGPLKIENPKLKILVLSCENIDRVEVSTLSVDVLHIGSLTCDKENLVIANPNLRFARKFWSTSSRFSHTCYHISCPSQGGKNIKHQVMMEICAEAMGDSGSMSVRVDLMNKKEMDILKDVLAHWPGEMDGLEIMFKHNNAPREEGESFIERTPKMCLEETKPFPNAVFRASTVWLSNFSCSKEEFALASCLITQGKVISCMLITPSSSSQEKKLEIEAAVVNLRKLRKDHRELSIGII